MHCGLGRSSRSVEGRSSMAGCCRTRKEHAGWSLAVSSFTLDVGEWAQENFGECDLGDVRRTRRAVTVARQMAEDSDGSTPDQAEDWSDLRALSRLFDAEEATFTALATPHWRHTRSLARGTVLLIGDTVLLTWGRDRLRHSSVGPRVGADGRWLWPRLLPAQFDDGRCGQRSDSRSG